jgi:hypothetical protein
MHLGCANNLSASRLTKNEAWSLLKMADYLINTDIIYFIEIRFASSNNTHSKPSGFACIGIWIKYFSDFVKITASPDV